MRKTSPPLFWGALSCLLVGLVLFSWMLVNAQAPDPSLFGQWTTLANLPFFPVHAHLLPTGKVMIWAGDTDPNAPHIENTATVGSGEPDRDAPRATRVGSLL